MRVLVLQSGFIVFIPFFDVGQSEARQAENWLKASFRLAAGKSSLIFDSHRKAENV
jgi:hypothetical protein